LVVISFGKPFDEIFIGETGAMTSILQKLEMSLGLLISHSGKTGNTTKTGNISTMMPGKLVKHILTSGQTTFCGPTPLNSHFQFIPGMSPEKCHANFAGARH